jgi:hypothetical protein
VAETLTPRLGIRRWSADTDTPSRSEFDADHAALDDLTAIDLQGTLAARPAFGIRGRYYYATDVGKLYRDTGTAWVEIPVGTTGGTAPTTQAFGDAPAAGADANPASATHRHGMPTGVGVRRMDTLVATRPNLNFRDSERLRASVTDDAGNSEAEVKFDDSDLLVESYMSF